MSAAASEATAQQYPPAGILTLNAGSSSIKFALYEVTATLQRRLHGLLDRVGASGTTLTVSNTDTAPASCTVSAADRSAAVAFLMDWLARRLDLGALRGVGHRIVHGMHRSEPERVSEELLRELRRIRSYDPEHLPHELELIEALRQRHPQLLQVACFDTAFHRDMPAVAKLLPIPRRLQTAEVQRYGFHGLSCAYLLEELSRSEGAAAASGRLILAHLGAGASMTAVRGGHSIDTSMGFTPSSGLPMSTRSGDLDPGLVGFLMRSAPLSVTQFERLANHESGLVGVSEISGDVRELLAREATDTRAAEALALFCYQAKKWIGTLAAALGGLDGLVFTAGIGENAPLIRARICSGLGFLGVELDAARNASNATLISSDRAAVRVRVIRTDEELMIARSVQRLLTAPR